jgi:hypothetical protein
MSRLGVATTRRSRAAAHFRPQSHRALFGIAEGGKRLGARRSRGPTASMTARSPMSRPCSKKARKMPSATSFRFPHAQPAPPGDAPLRVSGAARASKIEVDTEAVPGLDEALVGEIHQMPLGSRVAMCARHDCGEAHLLACVLAGHEQCQRSARCGSRRDSRARSRLRFRGKTTGEAKSAMRSSSRMSRFGTGVTSCVSMAGI